MRDPMQETTAGVILHWGHSEAPGVDTGEHTQGHAGSPDPAICPTPRVLLPPLHPPAPLPAPHGPSQEDGCAHIQGQHDSNKRNKPRRRTGRKASHLRDTWHATCRTHRVLHLSQGSFLPPASLFPKQASPRRGQSWGIC